MRHLRALCAIADAGSLHQAARRLGVSQPSLTTQLRRIENVLGAELFRRSWVVREGWLTPRRRAA